MIKLLLLALLPSLFLFGNLDERQIISHTARPGERTYEKMTVASGTVSIKLDANALYGFTQTNEMRLTLDSSNPDAVTIERIA